MKKCRNCGKEKETLVKHGSWLVCEECYRVLSYDYMKAKKVVWKGIELKQ